MASGGETLSRNDGVMAVYQSCRQSSASGRSLRAAACSDNVGMQLGSA
jgi:hypothetical protein